VLLNLEMIGGVLGQDKNILRIKTHSWNTDNLISIKKAGNTKLSLVLEL